MVEGEEGEEERERKERRRGRVVGGSSIHVTVWLFCSMHKDESYGSRTSFMHVFLIQQPARKDKWMGEDKEE